MLFFNTGGQKRYVVASGVVASVKVWDYVAAAVNALVGTFDIVTTPGVCIINIAAGDVNHGVGPQVYILLDAGGNCVGVLNEDVIAGPIPNQADVLAVPDELLDQVNGVEIGVTVRQALRAIAAVVAGKAAVAAGNPTYKGIGTSTDRVAATLGGGGVRSSVTLTL